MQIAALLTWVITAGIGSFMLLRWATRGGVRHTPGAGTHFRPARVFIHFGLAAAGLVVWIIYVVTDSEVLTWIALADLALVALLGAILVTRWTKDGRAAMRGERPEVDLAEQHIPRPPVLLHGFFAISTVILVLLTALGIGEI